MFVCVFVFEGTGAAKTRCVREGSQGGLRSIHVPKLFRGISAICHNMSHVGFIVDVLARVRVGKGRQGPPLSFVCWRAIGILYYFSLLFICACKWI